MATVELLNLCTELSDEEVETIDGGFSWGKLLSVAGLAGITVDSFVGAPIVPVVIGGYSLFLAGGYLARAGH